MQFLGGNILRLLRAQKKETLPETTQCTFFRKRVGYVKKKEGFEAPWEQKYGFRGDHPAFYYLSPSEFVQWWYCDRLKPPTSDNRTQWTEAGLAFRAQNVGIKEAEAPRAGEHYIVKDSQDRNPCSSRRHQKAHPTPKYRYTYTYIYIYVYVHI